MLGLWERSTPLALLLRRCVSAFLPSRHRRHRPLLCWSSSSLVSLAPAPCLVSRTPTTYPPPTIHRPPAQPAPCAHPLPRTPRTPCCRPSSLLPPLLLLLLLRCRLRIDIPTSPLTAEHALSRETRLPTRRHRHRAHLQLQLLSLLTSFPTTSTTATTATTTVTSNTVYVASPIAPTNSLF